MPETRTAGEAPPSLEGNVVTVTRPDPGLGPVQVSIVCPFYNESEIIEDAVRTLLDKLDELPVGWEVLAVNDGSRDGGEEIVARLADEHPRLRLVSYPFNRGRGHALRQGITRARGNIVVTTEIDLSWGEDVVERLYGEMVANPDTDIVVASPHLPGGGYQNVPFKRVLISKLGNVVIRTFMSRACTMNTGMTRAYRRDVIQTLPLEEDRKEFHLEVILKATALGYRVREIPCVLKWKEYKHEGRAVSRKSSSKINKLMVTHSLFSLFANPIRYVWGLAAATMLLSLAFLVWSVVRFALGLVSVFTAIIALSLGIFALLFFAFGVLAQQGNMIQRELWTMQRAMREEGRSDDPDG